MPAPFLTYLTVFKSRVGVCSLVVDLTGLAHQPLPALDRKLAARLSETRAVVVDDAAAGVLKYLREKRLITNNPRRRGRYRDFIFCGARDSLKLCTATGEPITELPVFQTDIWLSDPALPSTIGVPTPDNSGEALELTFQLALLTRSKNVWTPAGHLLYALRATAGRGDSLHHSDNPFLLGGEGIVLLRQILEHDGLMISEVARAAVECGPRFSRDQISAQFAEITSRAVARAAALGVRGEDLRQAREFQALITTTTEKVRRRSTREGGGRRVGEVGPGVLEHRVAPRLEWLTDLGYLTKAGLQRNGFEYSVAPALAGFVNLLDEVLSRRGTWADEVALEQWRRMDRWASYQRSAPADDELVAFGRAYQMLRRRIGPAPLREVALLAGMQLTTGSVAHVRQRLIDFANTTQQASLSGGRYTREPENLFMSDGLLTSLGVEGL